MRYFYLFVIIAITFSCGKTKKEAAKGSGFKGNPVSVNAIIVKEAPLDIQISSTGTVLANEQVILRCEISGRITGIFFNEGEYVNKGKLLIKVNDEDLQAQLLKAKYQVELAEKEELRKKQLITSDVISKEEYEISQNKLNTLKADVAYLEAQVKKTEVRAPFNGNVGLRNVSPGAYISPSIDLTSIQQIDILKVEFSVPEKYASLIENGTEVKLFADNGIQFHAQVYAKDALIDPDTRSLKARALFRNNSQAIIPGMFVKVSITTQKMKKALVVPSEALVPVMQGTKIYIVRKNKAIPRIVQAGYRTESGVAINEGLSANDTVIISGLMSVRDSSKVMVTKIVNK